MERSSRKELMACHRAISALLSSVKAGAKREQVVSKLFRILKQTEPVTELAQLRRSALASLHGIKFTQSGEIVPPEGDDAKEQLEQYEVDWLEFLNYEERHNIEPVPANELLALVPGLSYMDLYVLGPAVAFDEGEEEHEG